MPSRGAVRSLEDSVSAQIESVAKGTSSQDIPLRFNINSIASNLNHDWFCMFFSEVCDWSI